MQLCPSGHDAPPISPVMACRSGGRQERPPLPNLGAAATFGALATAKISVDASLAGTMIGKAEVNTKQICCLTGSRLSIRDHDSDPNLKNIELEGTFDQIKQATAMVQELILNVSSSPPVDAAAGVGLGYGRGGGSHGGGGTFGSNYGPGSNTFKSKLCEKFAKGTCTFGRRCHFAHGPSQLRKELL